MKALEVHNLRKEFVRREGARVGVSPRWAALSFEVERGECVAVLGRTDLEVHARPPALHPSAALTAARAQRLRARRRGRTPARCGGSCNRVSVEASLLQEDVRGREPRATRPASTACARADARADPGDPRRASASRRSRAREPMENLSRGMQQKVALARALLTAPDPAPARRADDGPRPALKLEVQDFIREVRADARRRPILLCTHDLRRGRGARRPRRDPRRAAGCSCLEPVEELKARFERRDARGGVLRRHRPRRSRTSRARRTTESMR